MSNETTVRERRSEYLATAADTLTNKYGEAYEVVPRQRADALIAALDEEVASLRLQNEEADRELRSWQFGAACLVASIGGGHDYIRISRSILQGVDRNVAIAQTTDPVTGDLLVRLDASKKAGHGA